MEVRENSEGCGLGIQRKGVVDMGASRDGDCRRTWAWHMKAELASSMEIIYGIQWLGLSNLI